MCKSEPESPPRKLPPSAFRPWGTRDVRTPPPDHVTSSTSPGDPSPTEAMLAERAKLLDEREADLIRREQRVMEREAELDLRERSLQPKQEPASPC